MKINTYIQCSERWKTPERDFSSVLLDLNENQFLSTFLSHFLATELHASDVFTYPNYQPLVVELAKYCQVSCDSLLLTNGADQAIELVLRLLFSAGDRVILPSPTFSLYQQILSVNGIEPVRVAFMKQAQRFMLPVQAIIDALPTCDGLILCNPNNPLGTRIAPEQITLLVERCVTLDKPLIVDESYFEYLQWSCLPAMRTIRQLFVIRSFSKYFGLAGLRLGYVVTQPDSVRQLLKVRGPWDVNHVAVKAALYCLKNLAALDKAHQQLAHTKREVTQFCRANGIDVYESDTNFLLLQDQCDGRLADAFRQANIRVADCTQYMHSFGLLDHVLRVAVPAITELCRFKGAVLRGSVTQAGGGHCQ